MKRRLFKLVLFILLGITTTWTVAWCITIFTDSDWAYGASGDMQTIKIGEIHWVFRESSGWGILKVSSRGFRGKMGTSYIAMQESIGIVISHNSKPPYWSAPYKLPDSLPNFGTTDIAYGWPFLALRYNTISTGFSSKYGVGFGLPMEQSYHFSIKVPSLLKGLTENDRLPLQPIWWGLIADTLLYATAWLLLLCGPFAARRFIRHERGFCIKCGYDLRETSGGCPECGWGREAEA